MLMWLNLVAVSLCLFSEVNSGKRNSTLDFVIEYDSERLKVARKCEVGSFLLHCNPCDVIRIVNVSYAGRSGQSGVTRGKCHGEGAEQELDCFKPVGDESLKTITNACNNSQSCRLNYTNSTISCGQSFINTCCLEIVFFCEQRDSLFLRFRSNDSAGNVNISLKCNTTGGRIRIDDVILGFSNSPGGCYMPSKNTGFVKGRCDNNNGCEILSLAGETGCGDKFTFNDVVHIFYRCTTATENNNGHYNNHMGQSCIPTTAPPTTSTKQPKPTLMIILMIVVVVFLLLVLPFCFVFAKRRGLLCKSYRTQLTGNDVSRHCATEGERGRGDDVIILDSSAIESRLDLEAEYEELNDYKTPYANAVCNDHVMVSGKNQYDEINLNACTGVYVNQNQATPAEMLKQRRRKDTSDYVNADLHTEHPARMQEPDTAQMNVTPLYAEVQRRSKRRSQPKISNSEKLRLDDDYSLKTASALYSDVLSSPCERSEQIETDLYATCTLEPQP